MQDLISRQAAIDALDVLCQEHRYKIPGKRETYSEYNEAWQDALDRAEGIIFNLPSAHPEQRWIPVTERLPEKYIGKWMCCMDDGTIEILPYDTPGDGSKECVFYYWEDDYTVVKPNVVAWMPLPEPYKER